MYTAKFETFFSIKSLKKIGRLLIHRISLRKTLNRNFKSPYKKKKLRK